METTTLVLDTNNNGETRLTPGWQPTRDQVDLIKRTVAKGCSDDELHLFLYVAKRTGLDPLLKQIYAVKRWSQNDGKEIMSIQTGIDGLRVVAERTQHYAPGKEPQYEYAADGKLRSATAFVKKQVGGTWHETAATAFLEEYAQRKRDGGLTQFWRDKPHVMLAKCAEALALRRCFPMDLAGLYAHEEMMAQADAWSPPEWHGEEAGAVTEPEDRPAPKLQAPRPAISKTETTEAPPPSVATTTGKSPFISVAQGRRLWAIAKKRAEYLVNEGLVEITADEIINAIVASHGITTKTEIPWKIYETIVGEVEGYDGE